MYTSRDLLKDIIKEAVTDVLSERLIGTIKKFADENKPPITKATNVEKDKNPSVPEKKEIPVKKNNADDTKDSKILLYKKLKRQAM